ncbi:MAG TPA: hypothetical protein VFG30_08345, partial [Polyangiales bacterium]|nr:hypothetical protein [Polyangiales bacterium]
MRDWFAYSAYARPELAQAVNRQLDAIFRDFHARLSDQRANGSLYVTGSLARQEPSIDIRGPSARLRSDIDLVFATTEEEVANPCIASLEHWARELWPDYDVSVVFVPLAGVHELRSCFARDFSLAVDAPLYQGVAGCAALPKRTATTTDYFESAIHQAASLLLFDDTGGSREWLYSRDRDYHRVRAALELLRCIVATETPVVRLCELREHANAVSLRRLVTPEEVVVAIRARELFDGTGTSLDVLDLLRAAASICIVDGTPDRGYYDVVAALD